MVIWQWWGPYKVKKIVYHQTSVNRGPDLRFVLEAISKLWYPLSKPSSSQVIKLMDQTRLFVQFWSSVCKDFKWPFINWTFINLTCFHHLKTGFSGIQIPTVLLKITLFWSKKYVIFRSAITVTIWIPYSVVRYSDGYCTQPDLWKSIGRFL